MFVAIVGAGIVGIVAVASDDDDYSDHRNYSRYSDAQLRSDISTAENRLRTGKNEKIEMEHSLDLRILEMTEELYYQNVLNPGEAFDESLIEGRIREMEDKLNQEIALEQQDLKAIDDVIMAINNYQLGHKI